MVMFGEIKDNGPSLIEQRLEELQPEIVVEFGAGRYSDILGPWAEDNDAVLYTYHSEPSSLDQTRIACRKLNSVRVLFAPIDLRKRQYKISALPIGIDFVVIDGPKRNIGKQEVLGLVWPNLARSGQVFLIDADNDHEKACIDRWEEEFNLDLDFIDDGKIAVITKA